MSRLVTVFGATGAQGGGVVSALLARDGWKVRGVTRNPDSDKAKALAAQGVEVVKASLDDKESIKAAVRGAYGVYLVTNYWESMDAERETKQGKDAAEACKEEGVKHFVYSGLENVKRLTGLAVPHFDAKGAVEDFLPGLGLPYTIVRFSMYFDFMPAMAQKQEDGTYVWMVNMGTDVLHGVAVSDGGPVVASILEQPDEYLGKAIGLSGDCRPVSEYTDILTKHTGKTYKHVDISFEEFVKLGIPAGDDLGAMFQFYRMDKCIRDIELTKKLNPSVQSFEDYVKANRDKIIAMQAGGAEQSLPNK